MRQDGDDTKKNQDWVCDSSLSSGWVVTELRSETNCYGSPVLSRNILIMFVMTVRIIITGEGEQCFNERDQVRITGKLGPRENTNYLDKPFPHRARLFSDFFNVVKLSFTAINRCHKWCWDKLDQRCRRSCLQHFRCDPKWSVIGSTCVDMWQTWN